MPRKISPADLPALLENLPPGGTIELTKSPQGEITMADTPKTKDELIAEKYPHLRGRGISLTDAARKYDVPRGAIKGWVYQSNDVSFVDESCYPKLVDEAEVALCAEIYKARKAAGTSGLPYFDSQGYLITEVKRPASTRNRQAKKMPEK